MSFTASDQEPARAAATETGHPENPVEISDPRALRALAHPARLTILQHLILDGPATATECAEVAGLSPSACSYHLRALARYGFVGEDPAGGADRRHRPWRARSSRSRRERCQPASGGASGQPPARAERAGQFDQVRAEYLDHEAEYPAEWQRAAGTSQDVLHVTPAELDEIRARFTRSWPGTGG